MSTLASCTAQAGHSRRAGAPERAVSAPRSAWFRRLSPLGAETPEAFAPAGDLPHRSSCAAPGSQRFPAQCLELGL